MQDYFETHYKIIQSIYMTLFPQFYTSNDALETNLSENYILAFKEWSGRKTRKNKKISEKRLKCTLKESILTSLSRTQQMSMTTKVKNKQLQAEEKKLKQKKV